MQALKAYKKCKIAVLTSRSKSMLISKRRLNDQLLSNRSNPRPSKKSTTQHPTHHTFESRLAKRARVAPPHRAQARQNRVLRPRPTTKSLSRAWLPATDRHGARKARSHQPSIWTNWTKWRMKNYQKSLQASSSSRSLRA